MNDVVRIGDGLDWLAHLEDEFGEGITMKITDDARDIKQVAQSVRQGLEQKHLTLENSIRNGISAEACDECVARCVLEQERIPVTEQNIKIVLDSMKG